MLTNTLSHMEIKEFDVIVVYEDPLKKIGIKAMLNAPEEFKFNLYEDISNLEELRKSIVSLKPDFIIIDVNFNFDDTGIKLAHYTRLHSSRTKIIIMASTLDDTLTKQLKELDIKWIVYKAESVESITKCAGRAIQNKPYISKRFRETWLEEKKDILFTSHDILLRRLSKTEIEILNQVALGKTNPEIANELYKSHRTISNHRLNICKKLDLKGNNALFKFTMKLSQINRQDV